MAEASWIVPAITGATGLLSGLIVARINSNTVVKQLQHQRELEERKHERERETERLKYHRELREKKYDIYNRILRVDGENTMHTASIATDFEFEIYRTKIRPILYEGFHVIDAYVRKIVRDMDLIMQTIDWSEDREQEQDYQMIRLYSDLRRAIEKSFTETTS